MAYTKTAWVNDSVPALDAVNLNKIEQGIYDAHVKADAAIPVPASKNDGDVVYWDAASSSFKAKAVSGGAVVATTVAGLGTAAGGKLGLLRLGASPYDELAMIYDATKANWVSQVFQVIDAPTTKTTGNWGYQETGQYTFLPYKPYRDAGLTLSLRLFGISWSNQSNPYANIKLQSYFGVKDGGQAGPVDVYTSSYTSGTSATYRDSGWVNFAPAGYDGYDFIQLLVLTQADNTGQNNNSRLAVQARWLG